jgi:predicted nucleotide-binding protein
MHSKNQIIQNKTLLQSEKIRGIKLLKKVLEELAQYDPHKATEGKMAGLEARIKNTLGDIYGHGTPKYKSYSDASNLYPASIIWLNFGESPSSRLDITELERGKQRAISLIEAAITDLEESLDNEEIQGTEPTITEYDDKKIFIVHGHDEQTKTDVENVVSKLGLEPIILSDCANTGRHILQKFTEETDQIGFAIILMTPDDLGGKTKDDLNPRARQNVVMELGFFIGKLGPKRVAVILSDKNIEIPSDINGIVYTSYTYSDNAWKLGLLKELKHAGYAVDANKLL